MQSTAIDPLSLSAWEATAPSLSRSFAGMSDRQLGWAEDLPILHELAVGPFLDDRLGDVC